MVTWDDILNSKKIKRRKSFRRYHPPQNSLVPVNAPYMAALPSIFYKEKWINLLGDLAKRKKMKLPKAPKKSHGRTNGSEYRGIDSEIAAMQFVKGLGLTIIMQRFISPWGEIDILATQESSDILYVIEVKSNNKTVGRKQRYNIRKTLEYFLQQYPSYQNYEIAFEQISYKDDTYSQKSLTLPEIK